MPGNSPSRQRSWRPGLAAGVVLALLGFAALTLIPAEEVKARPKAHETSLTAGQEYHAGSQASLRCAVHSVKSLTESIPLASADVTVQLRMSDGKRLPLFQGKTGTNGSAEAQFTVPAVAPGQYTLEVATRSSRGEEKLEHAVRIKADSKILLVTDKPLYQPGQVIHIRALSLSPFDLTPVANKELVFEVEDSKGNKVFKRSHRTSAFGVASVDFQLADEVNMGEYQVRANLGDHQSQKTVTVKRYVLPKFKTELTADKRYYLPKESLEAKLQTDYFFGKPVAGGKVKVTASTFDVQFRTFQTWEGTTDAQGHAQFAIKLPDYFVGQPLQKGDALVKLEVKVTDTADHSETITKTFPVSDQAIRVSLIPEAGRLIPGVENRVFAAAIYPDGSPAACDVRLWTGKESKAAPVATVKTNDAGLAEFRLTPRAEQFRPGPWEQRTIEMLGGQQQMSGGPKNLFDMVADAKDSKGNTARAVVELSSEPLGENVLLRLDKAIYRGGDTVAIDLRSSAGLPTAYLDVVKSGQTLLTRWLDVKAGQATYKLDLPTSIFGTLEIHAYQMLASGEIIRDARVVYVQPRAELKIQVKADKPVYLPGAAGQIRFEVTDSAGKPTAAALGVLIVDEAVYALQEMQPGLEKVYFTLQEELLKPQAQVAFKPSESLDHLIQQPAPDMPAAKQQIAQVLMAGTRAKPPVRWEVSPAVQRRRQVEGQVQQISWAIFNYAFHSNKPFMEYDAEAKKWVFRRSLLQDLVAAQQLPAAALNDPFGQPWTLANLATLEAGFQVDNLAGAVTRARMERLVYPFTSYTTNNRSQWFKDGTWSFPATVLADALRSQKQPESLLKDAWGEPIRLVKLAQKRDHQTGWNQFDYHELVAAGPDRKFGTADDVKLGNPNHWHMAQFWWLEDSKRLAEPGQVVRLRGVNRVLERLNLQMREDRPGLAGRGGEPMPAAAVGGAEVLKKSEAKEARGPGDGNGGGSGGPPLRVREYFPETMLWQPALITDDRGIATLPLGFADSITTWRMTASASSKGGLLGSVTAPLRVFQDFFVDLDLPVSLTQNDEVAFPLAVYNYLKTPQTVKLELEQEPWFELADSLGRVRSLALKPNEVTAVKFRIRARKLGTHPLTVKAYGSKLSDAIKRSIEVVPDGTKKEQVVTDRLTGRVTQTIDIPTHAIPDSQKLFVKIYPGIMSQVLEGTEGMLRLPGG